MMRMGDEGQGKVDFHRVKTWGGGKVYKEAGCRNGPQHGVLQKRRSCDGERFYPEFSSSHRHPPPSHQFFSGYLSPAEQKWTDLPTRNCGVRLKCYFLVIHKGCVILWPKPWIWPSNHLNTELISGMVILFPVLKSSKTFKQKTTIKQRTIVSISFSIVRYYLST